MRAFIALPVSGAALDGIARLQQHLPEGRPLPEENLHLTLAFLDEQQDDHLAEGCPVQRRVDDRESGHARRGDRGEQRLDPAGAARTLLRHRQHEQCPTGEVEHDEAGEDSTSGMLALPEVGEPPLGARGVHER